MDVQECIEAFEKKLPELLASDCIKHVEFSGETYQIEIFDPELEESLWPFLQLKDERYLKDFFCTCEEADEAPCCIHVALALAYIQQKGKALHLRHLESPWKAICECLAEDQHFSLDNIERAEKGVIQLSTEENETPLLELRCQDEGLEAAIEDLLFNRPVETEENSIKFSNLSESRIQKWREGRPDFDLRFELSFWGDLAKFFLTTIDRHSGAEIRFEFEGTELPHALTLSMPTLTASFALNHHNLPSLIPTLENIPTNLSVRSFQESAIDSIRYFPNTRRFGINAGDEALAETWEIDTRIRSNPDALVGGWVFIAGRGFFSHHKHPLLQLGEIRAKDAEYYLNTFTSVFQKYLADLPLHPDPVGIQNDVSFDKDWTLHIRSFLFTPGDLDDPLTQAFGSWIYVHEAGFFRLKEDNFSSGHQKVPRDQVSDFVTANRNWLHTLPGFEIHLSNFESQLTYSVSPSGSLSFDSKSEVPEGSQDSVDFGLWIYLAGTGFFCKSHTRLTLPVRPGVNVPEDQVASFITAHKEDLEQVPGFFSSSCPIQSRTLNISLDQDERVVSHPIETLSEGVDPDELRFYGEFVYQKGRGFSLIPSSSRLPSPFRKKRVLPNQNLPKFFDSELPKLKPFVSHLDPRLERPAFSRLVLEEIFQDSERGPGWVLARFTLFTPRNRIAATSLWKPLRKGKHYLFDLGGLLDLDDPRIRWIGDIPKKDIFAKEKLIRLSTFDFLKLQARQDWDPPSLEHSEGLRSWEFLKSLEDFRSPSKPDISLLQSTLRTYQQTGLEWLWFLAENALSGLLCDDMGLGKTHQAMALITALKAKAEGKPFQVLVVCPTSVIYSWTEKLKRFLPSIKPFIFYGAQRDLGDFDESYDLLLTSYGTLRREKEDLQNFDFDLAIYDEIQIAKNQHSQVHQALLSIQASMRLGLTGTPIENNLREMKALLDLVLPGYMPRESAFRENFLKPIEKFDDQKQKERLKRMIRPFLLRRRKKDVLQDLPEKTEETIPCELSEKQRELYRQILERGRKELLETIQDESQAVPLIHVFALLTKLKQVCNHPALFLNDIENFQKYESGKWNLFIELLEEARNSEQKVVCFSQYLGMLDLVEAYLKANEIGFAGIRGATKDRASQLERFQNDPKCEIFVASLNAAGVGIDLTAASVVIHIDRWWNAAREDQATDRVHRIGQERGVQVFKLVSRNSLEEGIDRLISKKSKLLEDYVESEDENVVKQLSRGDLIEILEADPEA